MAEISLIQLPVLEGTDVDAARRWFARMVDLGLTIHADDGYEVGDLTEAAAEEANRMLQILFKASEEWAYPDVIYPLAGEGRFAIEQSYPDRVIVDAASAIFMRTGFQFLKGAENPTFIGEEGGRFFAIEVVQEKRLSEARFVVSPMNDASFGPDSKIDTTGASIDGGRSVEVAAIDAVESTVECMLIETITPR